MKHLFYIVLISGFHLNSYSQIQDSLTQQDSSTIPKIRVQSQTFLLSTQRVFLNADNQSITHFRSNWTGRIREKLYLELGYGRIDLRTNKINVYSGGFRVQGERYGYGGRAKLFDDRIQGFKRIEFHGFKYVKPTLIANSELSIISTQGTILAPMKIGLTKIIKKIGLSFNLNQDVLKLASSKPLYHMSLTYETSKANVYSAYLVIGNVNQPIENQAFNSLNIYQESFGAWTRIKMNSWASIAIAAGHLRLKIDDTIITSNEINFSLILKFSNR